MNSRIICIGNRFLEMDSSGPAVFELLSQRPLPDGIEVIQGGLAGLDLLPFLEQGGRVVFVDSVRGFAQPDQVVVLKQEDIVPESGVSYYGHGGGLTYLLGVLPLVCEGTLPEEIILVGLEGKCSWETVNQAADLSLSLALPASCKFQPIAPWNKS